MKNGEYRYTERLLFRFMRYTIHKKFSGVYIPLVDFKATTGYSHLIIFLCTRYFKTKSNFLSKKVVSLGMKAKVNLNSCLIVPIDYISICKDIANGYTFNAIYIRLLCKHLNTGESKND